MTRKKGEIKKKLIEIRNEERSKGKKANLEYKKLWVEEKLYVWNEERGKLREERKGMGNREGERQKRGTEENRGREGGMEEERNKAGVLEHSGSKGKE